MMPATARHILPDRFEFLMGLYDENYRRLSRLFAPQTLSGNRYVSSVGDGLDIHLAIRERHAYTLELSLSYGMTDFMTGQPSPSARLRVYTDARLAEVMHCEPGKLLWQLLRIQPHAGAVMEHRLRMNSFLNRWLEYLADQGHGRSTLKLHDGICAQADTEALTVP